MADDAVSIGVGIAGAGDVEARLQTDLARHGIGGGGVHADLPIPVLGHKPEGRVNGAVHHFEVEAIALADVLPVGDEGGIIGQWDEVTELGQVLDPAVADGLHDQTGEVGVRQQEPAARRDTVGLVVEPLGKHVSEIPHRSPAQDLRVDGGDAIGAVGANNGQMRHADLLDGCLLDETHAHHTRLIAWEMRANLVQEAAGPWH